MEKGSELATSNENLNLNIFVTEVDPTNKPLISTQIRSALFNFLKTNVRPFSPDFINPKYLETFLRHPENIKEMRNLSNETNLNLYTNGKEADYFIVILEGSAVLEFASNWKLVAGLFSFYGVRALIDDNEKTPLDIINNNDKIPTPFKPDYSLTVNTVCIYFQISRKQYIDIVKKSVFLANNVIVPNTTTTTQTTAPVPPTTVAAASTATTNL
jgi:hypothetical protein